MLTYMITGARDEETELRELQQAVRDGVDRVQIRRKNASGRELERLSSRILALLGGTDVRAYVNDRLDVAIAVGAFGVHLPENGIPVERARAVAPSGFEIGASVHSLDQAIRAEEAGADFVVFGPVFATSSKPGHRGFGLDAVREITSRITSPVFAIGGLRDDRVDAVLAAGAQGIAGISAFANGSSRARLLARLRELRSEAVR